MIANPCNPLHPCHGHSPPAPSQTQTQTQPPLSSEPLSKIAAPSAAKEEGQEPHLLSDQNKANVPNSHHHEAQTRGLLRAMIAHFSSTPIDPTIDGGSNNSHNSHTRGGSSNNPMNNNSIIQTNYNTNNNNMNDSFNHHRYDATYNYNNDLSSSSIVSSYSYSQPEQPPPHSTTTSTANSPEHNEHEQQAVAAFSSPHPNSNNCNNILTKSEREYLEGLLLAGDVDEIEKASQTLANTHLFPTTPPSYDSNEAYDFEEESQKDNENETEPEIENTKEVVKNQPASEEGTPAATGDPATFATPQTSNKTKKENKKKTSSSSSSPRSSRFAGFRHRDSRVQQHLFRLHQIKAVQPSHVLHRLQVTAQQQHQQQQQQQQQQPKMLLHRNSIIDTHHNSILDASFSGDFSMPHDDVIVFSDAKHRRLSNDGDSGAAVDQQPQPQFEDHWDPFQDVTSWLDGSEGVEVTDSRDVDSTENNNDNPTNKIPPPPPFKILGTSADDTSCHPHVLSPPLMESLLAFVPEVVQGWAESMTNTTTTTTTTTPNNNSATVNWWLKYSLVRDGGGLFKLLRHVRASTFTVLAIETTDGHVLGSFTSVPWRLSAGWYHPGTTSSTNATTASSSGSSKSAQTGVTIQGQEEYSFLWRMRQCRCLDGTRSIAQQVCQESEIQVYPYRGGTSSSMTSGGSDTNNASTASGGGGGGDSYAVQYCSKENGIRLGQKELIMPGKTLSGKHYGHALCLAPNLKSGTTSTSETFGNPCLLNGELRGARFQVANLEVWTLTPHNTVADAEQSELSNLFLDGGRRAPQNLRMWNILVGQPI